MLLFIPIAEPSRELRGTRDTTPASCSFVLTREIAYWDRRAEQLKQQEQAGKAGARLDAQEARRRADDLQLRLERRLAQLDREAETPGNDIESRVPGTGGLRFIEVKGRIAGADTVAVTKKEFLYSLEKPDDFILALVEFGGDDRHRVLYLRQPFQRDPDFGVTSVNCDFAELLARAGSPR